jgi:putative component of membrane protein insertase Oxa1/YidC/SpoIIIJ protein YidD
VLLLLGFFGWLDSKRPAQDQIVARASIAGVRFYQTQIHPYTERYVHCRLTPSCSRFALDALRNHGVQGLSAIADRLLLCNRTPARAQVSSGGLALALLLLQSDQAAGAAGCLGCAGLGGFLIVLIIGLFVSWIALLVWVVRDFRARSADNPILWMLLVLFFHVVGLIIYLFARPKGTFVQCPNCKGNKLAHLQTCPQCGHLTGGPPSVQMA